MSQGEVLPATLLVPHRGPRVKRQVMLAGAPVPSAGCRTARHCRPVLIDTIIYDPLDERTG